MMAEPYADRLTGGAVKAQGIHPTLDGINELLGSLSRTRRDLRDFVCLIDGSAPVKQEPIEDGRPHPSNIAQARMPLSQELLRVHQHLADELQHFDILLKQLHTALG